MLPRLAKINGFPGYLVGEDGTVWSCKTRGPSPQLTAEPRQLRTFRKKSRYAYVRVTLRVPGTPRNAHLDVHRLVLEAFIGPCPAGMECRHLDGDLANNRLENLCWGTPVENAADITRHGRRYRPTGSLNNRARLTEADVCFIRKLWAEGQSFRTLARRFGVKPYTISRAARGESWTHV
jgi:hypothetical protein